MGLFKVLIRCDICSFPWTTAHTWAMRTVRVVFVWQLLLLGLLAKDHIHASCFGVRHSSSALRSSVVVWASVSKKSSPKEKERSLGADIQDLRTLDQAAATATRFWKPTDPRLPSHLSKQAIHWENQQRWASQWLERLVQIQAEEDREEDVYIDWERVLGAASRRHAAQSGSNPNVVVSTLACLHVIVGRQYEQDSSSTILPHSTLQSEDILPYLQQLQSLACQFQSLPLPTACQLAWTMRGLQCRVEGLYCGDDDALQQRVQRLPFEILPQGVVWDNVLKTHEADDICQVLQRDIPFVQDTITTRRGQTVTERRATAWITQSDIGALAYSGKLMEPHPMPKWIQQHVMDPISQLLSLRSSLYDIEEHGSFFDCALCNYYADKSVACKFHTDPEHGTHWHRTTVVVAAGSDRKFSFKPTEYSSWEDWDDPLREASSSEHSAERKAATTHLFAGDLVVMRGSCNDHFFHSVHVGDTDKDRVSLVLKRALDRGGGRKGHGLPGRGRRSRRSRKQS